MSQRVNLDAMIPREDFARSMQNEGDAVNLIKEFPISYLDSNSPVRRLLRKPDFQRETNHWTPEQLAMFVESFLDNDVIPSLILWKSDSFIFVIDGGHRLSALRAWMTDDYGDGAISHQFYNGEISDTQKKIAKRTRALIERRIGRYTSLSDAVGTSNGHPERSQRAAALFTRTLQLQWVSGSPEAAETSFFKINSQGTPLDDVEQMLIINRSKPIAIGARAIVRAGQGHRYWSKFKESERSRVEGLASELFHLLFKPEVESPLRTLDIPLGGSVSPVDSLSLIIEFLAIADSKRHAGPIAISDYETDTTGEETIKVLRSGLDVAKRITGNSPGSLGLHPAVYFYNERGRPSRFLFLGFSLLLAERLRGNDDAWFKKFVKARSSLEQFLVNEKSLLGIVLQNMAKRARVSKMRDLFAFLVDRYSNDLTVTADEVIQHLGVRGKIFDGGAYIPHGNKFSDDAKSMVFIRRQLEATQRCSICSGYLDTMKSLSYDHTSPVSKGGPSSADNMDLVHPYCNTGIKVGR